MRKIHTKIQKSEKGQVVKPGGNHQDRPAGRIPRTAAVILLSVILLLSAGCSSDIPIVSSVATASYVFAVGGEQCSVEEAKMILLQYQKEYATLYGVNLWDHDYGEEESLENYVKDLTVSQLAEVYTLDVIAAEQEVALSEGEKDEAAAAARDYIDSLSEAELDYLGADESTAESLFERYLLAQKLYASLTENVSQEVSDDEAHVMEMEQICVSDAETAAEVLAKLDEGSDFSSLAESYNESETTSIQVSRTTYSEEVTEILFALDTGMYSDVIEIDGSYYLFYCTNYFNEELTDANKEKVVSQRMEEAVTSTYNTYKDQLDSTLNEAVWDEVTVDTTLELTGASFEEIFEEYFG